MLVEQLAEMIGRAHGSALDDVTRALWAAVGAEQIGEEDTTCLLAAIEARRSIGRPAGGPKLLGAIKLRLAPQRSLERSEALERARRWAAAGRMPPAIACKFTPGEQAALAVIVSEVSKRQSCDKSIGEIAAVAGVSESTVKRAVRQAMALGFLTKQERRLSRYRNDTNILRIISKAWLVWIELRTAKGGGQPRPGTNTIGLREGKKEGSEVRENRTRGRPSNQNQRSFFACG